MIDTSKAVGVSVEVHFFKPSGKWYLSEEVIFPIGTMAWDGRNVIESYLRGRLEGMTAVITSESPFGYPQSYPELYGRANDAPGSIGDAIKETLIDLQERRLIGGQHG